jgi:mannonate dehydratase
MDMANFKIIYVINLQGRIFVMQITFRWYGEKLDKIPLEFVKQIPGVKGIVWALHDVPAGDYWEFDRIKQTKDYFNKSGFNNEVVESLNVHEDI